MALEEVPALIEQLNDGVRRLEALFPGRKFTLDGHLVGSIGEVVAAFLFDLVLLPASSQGHDATAGDGRLVQIKLTQGTQVGIRSCPQHLIVLTMGSNGRFSVAYNGPGEPAWNSGGRVQKNGQKPLSLAKLRLLNNNVAPADKLPLTRAWSMLESFDLDA